MNIAAQPPRLTGKELVNRITQRTSFPKSRFALLNVRIAEARAEQSKVARHIAEEYAPLVHLANKIMLDYPGTSLRPVYGSLIYTNFPRVGVDGAFAYESSEGPDIRFVIRFGEDDDDEVQHILVLNPEFVSDPDAFIERMRKEHEAVQESKKMTTEEISLNLLRSLITKHPDQARYILGELGL